MELHTWNMEPHNSIMERQNSVMELHNSIMEPHKSIMELHNWIMQLRKYGVWIWARKIHPIPSSRSQGHDMECPSWVATPYFEENWPCDNDAAIHDVTLERFRYT